MENVDKDVQLWINRFKDYDALRASQIPVMEKKDGKPEWLEDAEKKAEEKEGKKVDEDKQEKTKSSTGGEITKTKTGLVHKAGDNYTGKKNDKGDKSDKSDKDEKDLDESADPEVLAWMERFSKLGTMTGYNR